MRIATWNVNSARQRLPHIQRYLRETAPDVLCLQEIKCVDAAFPRDDLESLGYNVATHGQKGFNGVAILTRRPAEIARGLPGFDHDPQARYMEALTTDDAGKVARIASIYLPNGNPVDSDKLAYKYAFMSKLEARAKALLALEETTALVGDFNVIPAPIDARSPQAWAGDALFLPETRARFHALTWLGYRDAIRALNPSAEIFTFWDYQAGAFPRNDGIRIDHILLSPQAIDRLRDGAVDAFARGWDKPSDHAPARVDLA